MRKATLTLIMISAVLSGCHKPLAHPEDVDPVYRDLRTEANKAIGTYKEKEKAATEAKKTFDKAAIRTGERLNAQEEYFSTLNQQQKLAEKYRYLVLKAEMRRKHDLITYPQRFKDKLPWPDVADWEEYEVEKRMQNASREWNPEKRIQDRAMASVKKEKSAESEEHE